MQRICANAWCEQTFEVTDEDLAFYDNVSPIIGDRKYPIPPPSLCPLCRMQRRQSHRNDRSLYQARSALTDQSIISMYDPEQNFVVYDQKEWWDDGWDPLAYGREFDFSRPFFAQFRELQQVVPRFNVFNRQSENCEYVNYAPHCKSCYLLFGSWFNEDCCYGQTLNECKSCFDSLFLNQSELCYENIDGNNNYHSCFCQNCAEAVDSTFCFDCKGVRNCMGCWNLRNKENYLWNRPASIDQIANVRRKLSSHSGTLELRSVYQSHVEQNAIHRAITGFNNENCTGDFLFNCKHARFCFSAYQSQDIAYSARVFDMKDSMDFEGGGKGELVYEGMSNDFSYHSIGCMTCEQMTHAHYCDLCFHCKDCFGCVGLKQKQFCIFNTQYSKEMYETLVPKIIEHMRKTSLRSPSGDSAGQEWGELFPVRLSLFAYNETLAQEYFPLSEAEILQRGWRWKDRSREGAPVIRPISAQELPDSILEFDQNILERAVLSEKSGRPFRITKRELEFYRRQGLALPRLHPDERHRERFLKRNPRKLWKRTCAMCSQEMETTYAPERLEIVYCEKCYLEAVY